jgi:hypothetical protein
MTYGEGEGERAMKEKRAISLKNILKVSQSSIIPKKAYT